MIITVITRTPPMYQLCYYYGCQCCGVTTRMVVQFRRVVMLHCRLWYFYFCRRSLCSDSGSHGRAQVPATMTMTMMIDLIDFYV